MEPTKKEESVFNEKFSHLLGQPQTSTLASYQKSVGGLQVPNDENGRPDRFSHLIQDISRVSRIVNEETPMCSFLESNYNRDSAIQFENEPSMIQLDNQANQNVKEPKLVMPSRLPTEDDDDEEMDDNIDEFGEPSKFQKMEKGHKQSLLEQENKKNGYQDIFDSNIKQSEDFQNFLQRYRFVKGAS